MAEDACHDSLGTLPYLAKLVDASPDTLSMRVVRKSVGLPVMEAHRTPDGRPATPTIVVLDAEGGVKGVIAERPAALWDSRRSIRAAASAGSGTSRTKDATRSPRSSA